MFPAFLTTIFFSISVVFASRSAKVIGGAWANAGRITVALLFLAIWGHAFGQGLRGPALPWFLVSGVIGFGLGDIALFGALTRIGPRLAILLTQCLAAPIATFTEWAWLGTTVQPMEMLCAGLILFGVALALAPDHGFEGDRRTFWIGVLWGIGSACGQAFGAVISRRGYAAAAAAGFSLDGGTAAYQRVIGGVVMVWLALAVTGGWRLAPAATGSIPWRNALPLVLVNALAGPVIGVACFQWALSTTASGIVLPIVATSPLVTILLTFARDGTRPSRRALSGGLIAVAGAVLLNVLKAAR
jgi:drug/metabolite transporter (DMT)-like permease